MTPDVSAACACSVIVEGGDVRLGYFSFVFLKEGEGGTVGKKRAGKKKNEKGGFFLVGEANRKKK